jgi:orotate phosphoribosyltransferase
MNDSHVRVSAREGLMAAIASVPGLIAPGITEFDGWLQLPIQPLFLEHLYGDKAVWDWVTEIGADTVARNGVEVVVGAESAGIPLATSIAIKTGRPLAFVRKVGYQGHVKDEPKVRGGSVVGRRAMIVDDAIWTGSSLDRFCAALQGERAEVVCAFAIVDMRQLAAGRWQETAARKIVPDVVEHCGTYLELLDAAQRADVLTERQLTLIKTFIFEGIARDDDRWNELDQATFTYPTRKSP